MSNASPFGAGATSAPAIERRLPSALVFTPALATSNLPFIRNLQAVAHSYSEGDYHRSVMIPSVDRTIGSHGISAPNDRPQNLKIISNWKLKHGVISDGHTPTFSFSHVDDVFPANFAQYLRWVKFEQQKDFMGYEAKGKESSDSQEEKVKEAFSVNTHVNSSMFGGGGSAASDIHTPSSSSISYAAATVANIILAHVEASSCDKTTTISGGGGGSLSTSSSAKTFRYSYSNTRSDPASAYNYGRGAANDNASRDGSSFYQCFPLTVGEQHAIAVFGLELFVRVGRVSSQLFSEGGGGDSVGRESLRIPMLSVIRRRNEAMKRNRMKSIHRGGKPPPTMMRNNHNSFERDKSRPRLASSVVKFWQPGVFESTNDVDEGGANDYYRNNGAILREEKEGDDDGNAHRDCVVEPPQIVPSSIPSPPSPLTTTNLQQHHNFPLIASEAAKRGHIIATTQSVFHIIERLWGLLDAIVVPFAMSRNTNAAAANPNNNNNNNATVFRSHLIQRNSIHAIAPICSNPWLLFCPKSHRSPYDCCHDGGDDDKSTSRHKSETPAQRFGFSSFDVNELRKTMCQWLGVGGGAASSTTFPSSSVDAHGNGIRAAIEVVLELICTPVPAMETSTTTQRKEDEAAASSSITHNEGRRAVLCYPFLDHCFFKALRPKPRVAIEHMYHFLGSLREGNDDNDEKGSDGEYVYNSDEEDEDMPYQRISSVDAGMGLFPFIHLIQRQLTSSVQTSGPKCDEGEKTPPFLPSSVSMLSTRQVLEEFDQQFKEIRSQASISSTTSMVDHPLPHIAGPPMLHVMSNNFNLRQYYIPARLFDAYTVKRNQMNTAQQAREGAKDGAIGRKWISVASIVLLKSWGLPSEEPVLDVLTAHHIDNSDNEHHSAKTTGNSHSTDTSSSPRSDHVTPTTTTGCNNIHIDLILVAGPIAHEHLVYLHDYNARMAQYADDDHSGNHDHGGEGRGRGDDGEEKRTALDAHRREMERLMLHRRFFGGNTKNTGGGNDDPTPQQQRQGRRLNRSGGGHYYGGVGLIANVGTSFLTRTAEVYKCLPNANGKPIRLRIPPTASSPSPRLIQLPQVISAATVTTRQHAGGDQPSLKSETNTPLPLGNEVGREESSGGIEDYHGTVGGKAVAILSLSNLLEASSSGGHSSSFLTSIGLDDIDAEAATRSRKTDASSVAQSFAAVLMPLVYASNSGRRGKGGGEKSLQSTTTTPMKPQLGCGNASNDQSGRMHSRHTTVIVGAVLGPSLGVFESSFWSTVAALSRLGAALYEEEREARRKQKRRVQQQGNEGEAAALLPTKRHFAFQYTGSGSGLNGGGLGQGTHVFVAIALLEALEKRIGSELAQGDKGIDTNNNEEVDGNEKAMKTDEDDAKKHVMERSQSKSDELVNIFVASEALRKSLEGFALRSLTQCNIPFYTSSTVQHENVQVRAVDPAEVAAARLDHTLSAIKEAIEGGEGWESIAPLPYSLSSPDTAAAAAAITTAAAYHNAQVLAVPPLFNAASNQRDVMVHATAHGGGDVPTSIYNELTEMPSSIYLTDGALEDWEAIVVDDALGNATENERSSRGGDSHRNALMRALLAAATSSCTASSAVNKGYGNDIEGRPQLSSCLSSIVLDCLTSLSTPTRANPTPSSLGKEKEAAKAAYIDAIRTLTANFLRSDDTSRAKGEGLEEKAIPRMIGNSLAVSEAIQLASNLGRATIVSAEE